MEGKIAERSRWAYTSGMSGMTVHAFASEAVKGISLIIHLVYIAKTEESVKVLTAIVAEYVVISSFPCFKENILTTVKASGATIAFDAIGTAVLPRWTC